MTELAESQVIQCQTSKKGIIKSNSTKATCS